MAWFCCIAGVFNGRWQGVKQETRFPIYLPWLYSDWPQLFHVKDSMQGRYVLKYLLQILKLCPCVTKHKKITSKLKWESSFKSQLSTVYDQNICFGIVIYSLIWIFTLLKTNQPLEFCRWVWADPTFFLPWMLPQKHYILSCLFLSCWSSGENHLFTYFSFHPKPLWIADLSYETSQKNAHMHFT